MNDDECQADPECRGYREGYATARKDITDYLTDMVYNFPGREAEWIRHMVRNILDRFG